MDAFPLPDWPVLRKGARVWVAYSGGLDSTVLLHRLHAAGVRHLRALHVHHGLQRSADDWARHCRAQCRALGVPLGVLRVAIDADDPAGPEAAARQARYTALRSRMRAGDLLVTAHHRGDQAETVLLRLLRGAGVDGLAAMRPLIDFEPGHLWRPLLALPRSVLQAYAEKAGLRWIEDPHNQSPRYARSYLRQDVLPRLQQHWPQAEASLARAAGHCAQSANLLDDLAALDLAALSDAATLRVGALLRLSDARRRNLLRYWVRERGYEAPSSAALERLERELLAAKEDAQPLLHLGRYEFRRYRDRLYLMAPLPPPPKRVVLPWNGQGRLALPPGCGELRAAGRRNSARPALQVRFPQGGETLRPAAAARTRTLKNLFQEAGVPQWQRLRTPLIYCEGRLVSVADRWLTADWIAELGRLGLQLIWTPA